MLRASVMCALLVPLACAELKAVELDLPREGVSHLLLRYDALDRLERITAYEPGELSVAFGWEAGIGLRIVELEGGLAPNGVLRENDGSVRFTDATASIDEAWPLLPARRGLELEGAAFVEVSREATRAWVENLRFFRPPCGPPPVVRPIIGLAPEFQLAFALRFGDELIIGRSFERDITSGGVYRLPLGSLEPTPIPELTVSSTTSLVSPVGFVDGDRLFIHWRPAAEYEEVVLDRELRIVERHPVSIAERGVYLDRVEFAHDTVLARGRVFDGPEDAPPSSRFLEYARDTRVWRELNRSSFADTAACDGPSYALTLEIDGHRRGWVGLHNGPIVRFDLATTASIAEGHPMIAGGRYCSADYDVFADGTELLVTATRDPQLGTSVRDLLWRLPQQGWASIPRRTDVLGSLVAAVGPYFVVSGELGVLGVFERSTLRPELPPRQCHEVSSPGRAQFATRIDDRTLFVGGYKGSGVFLEFER